MNGFSKTDVPCDCGVISLALNDPTSGIKLNEQNLFVLETSGDWILSIYHCYFCGGILPSSDKPIWYPKLTPEEYTRLERLVERITSREEAIDRLGQPDYDDWSPSVNAINGEWVTSKHRNVEFYNLSEVANVEFYFFEDNTSHYKIELKRISPRHVESL